MPISVFAFHGIHNSSVFIMHTGLYETVHDRILGNVVTLNAINSQFMKGKKRSRLCSTITGLSAF